ncbi:ribulose-5-phosphate 4-epimerase [Klebsiella pneumoniae]|nr:ribulose-5-phosphate 4-epimerase [Klebsiella pneumoniae]
MTEQQLREEMVQIGASLFSRGYATGSAGNLSLLLPDGNLLATPTGACLGELQAQRLSVVTLQGEWISGDKPSKEVTFHRAVYFAQPGLQGDRPLAQPLSDRALLPAGTRSAQLYPPLYPPYVVMRVGDVPVVPYYRPGDDRIAQALAGLAPRYNAFLLANHGPVVTGSSLREATNNTEELEETARLIFTLGNREIRYLTADEVKELR